VVILSECIDSRYHRYRAIDENIVLSLRITHLHAIRGLEVRWTQFNIIRVEQLHGFVFMFYLFGILFIIYLFLGFKMHLHTDALGVYTTCYFSL
jgi:hypothetical protein